MSLATFVMVLVAAMLHAAWNLAMKDSGDRLVAAWAIMGVGGLASVPVLAALGPPPSAALGWLGVSVCIHVGYALALARAYELTDLAVAYPVARGTAPLLVTIGGVTLLGDSIAPLGVVGVVVVSAALMSMMRRGSLAGYRWAVLTGLFIAGYTLSDGAGVRAGDDAIRYIAVLFVLQTLVLSVVVLRMRGSGAMAAAVRAQPLRLTLAGLGGVTAYLLVLIASRTSPLGLVSGLRETSTAFGALGGYLFLGESVTPKHAAAIAAAIVGALLILAGS
ncbi:MAG: EamA family transporter [Candidatus Microthrix sp.]|uniref:Putative Transporter of the DMT superfamily n=1 Tax=Candidatus Neomicrothrix parvicella RN1 TaxID=1229780 RepID=R4Z6T9_9ACTN|nr:MULTISPECIES: EamA family transporter [Microthrix]MBL0204801.1 EamA family transporter [Candidatus Microthrix sp.]CCM65646.1 putative Transporter of the DMT superfamily [Candidatus Microthrix parvicella RN1]